MITAIILFGIAIIFFVVSLIKNRTKTKKSVKIMGKMFLNMAGELVGVLAIIGLLLAIIPQKTINFLFNSSNKLLSVIYAAIIGTITIIPGLIAFPLAGELKESGASLMALAAFITTLTMVGFATIPIEIRHFGKKFTFYRNIVSFVFAIIVALSMGFILEVIL